MERDLKTLLQMIEDAAFLFSDGHYTIFRFSNHWKVMLKTPDLSSDGRNEVNNLPEAKSLEEAILNCLKENFTSVPDC